MAIVDEEDASERSSAEVIDATGAVGNVTHDHTFDTRKALKDVRDCARIYEQSLGHLQRNCHRLCWCAVRWLLRKHLLDAPYRLRDLKIVIRRQRAHCPT